MPDFHTTEQQRERPSKSAAKRAWKQRQQRIEALARIAPERITGLALPPLIADEVIAAGRMKPSAARNRLVRHIANLFEQLDLQEQEQLDQLMAQLVG